MLDHYIYDNNNVFKAIKQKQTYFETSNASEKQSKDIKA